MGRQRVRERRLFKAEDAALAREVRVRMCMRVHMRMRGRGTAGRETDACSSGRDDERAARRGAPALPMRRTDP